MCEAWVRFRVWGDSRGRGVWHAVGVSVWRVERVRVCVRWDREVGARVQGVYSARGRDLQPCV